MVKRVPEIFKATRFGGGHAEVVAEACEVRLACNAYADSEIGKATVVAFESNLLKYVPGKNMELLTI